MSPPRFVFLHGFLGNTAEWQAVRDALSPQSESMAISLPIAREWDAAVATVVAAVPRESILVGYSMGARIALACAIRDPDRLRALALVSGHPGIADQRLRIERLRADEETANRLERTPLDQFLQDWYQQDVFTGAAKEHRRRWIAERMSIDQTYQAALLRCYSIGRQPDYRTSIKTLSLTGRLIVGASDPKYVALAQEISQLHHGLDVAIVPNAGHAVHRECPESVAIALNELAARTSQL